MTISDHSTWAVDEMSIKHISMINQKSKGGDVFLNCINDLISDNPETEIIFPAH